MRAQQKAAERRRGTIIVVVCVLVAVGHRGAAAYGPIMDSIRTSKYSGKPLTGIGSPASVCQKVTTKPADGNQQHLADGSPGLLHRRPAGVRQALPHARRHGPEVLHRPGPARPRHARAQRGARLHDPLVRPDRRQGLHPDGPDQGDREQVRRHDRPAGQVQGRAVDVGRRQARSPTASTSRSPTGRSAAPRTPRPAPTSRSASGSTARACPGRRSRPTWTTTRSATPPSRAGCSRSVRSGRRVRSPGAGPRSP